MKNGWYINGCAGWEWKNGRFVDKIEGGVQFSCREEEEEEYERYEREVKEEFKEAKSQLCNPFVSLDGPYTFEEIIDLGL